MTSLSGTRLVSSWRPSQALTGGVQPGHRLVQVDADPAHQPSGADELSECLMQGRAEWQPTTCHEQCGLSRKDPFASPACSAAVPISSNSASVTSNRIVRDRLTAWRPRRRDVVRSGGCAVWMLFVALAVPDR
jgi:hypothetical protein